MGFPFIPKVLCDCAARRKAQAEGKSGFSPELPDPGMPQQPQGMDSTVPKCPQCPWGVSEQCHEGSNKNPQFLGISNFAPTTGLHHE